MNKILRQIINKLDEEVDYLFFRRFVSWREVKRHQSKRYTPHGPRSISDKKTVVYMSDGFRRIGGLADRLRGIVALYSYCRDHNLEFRINFTDPFPREKYMVPNTYDWRLKAGELSWNSREVRPVHLLTVCQHNPRREERYQLRTLHRNLRRRYLQAHVNTAFYAVTYPFDKLFKELFQPSEQVRQRLNTLRPQLGDSYISVSTRFLELLGDFTEPRQVRQPLPENERKALMDKCIKAIETIHRQHPASQIFLTSDSVSFIKYACDKLDYCHSVNGPVAHIDVANGHSDEADMKTFIDFFTISDANYSYLLKSRAMYNSNFSRRAAQAGGHPFQVIEV